MVDVTSADSPLPGAWAEAKLNRATAHFEDLRTRVNAWFATDPFRVEHLVSDDGLRLRLYLRVDDPPPLMEWSTILGDCIHNLRAALDAAVWELAHQGGATPNRPKSVQFPFETSQDDWLRRRNASLSGLPEGLLRRLEAVQPFNHSQGGARVSALSLLNQLDIEDKHKAGIGAEVGATEAKSWTQLRFATEEAAERHVRQEQRITLKLRDGALLHDERTSDPIAEVRGNFDATVDFTVTTPGGHARMWNVLDTLFETVIITLDHLYVVVSEGLGPLPSRSPEDRAETPERDL